jgi:hypothetical protein
MRRVVGILMVIFGLAAIVGGIWKLVPPLNNTFYPPHIISSFIFAVLLIIHIWLNRKPIIKYFQNLRRWWILIGLGIILDIWLCVGMPMILMNE